MATSQEFQDWEKTLTEEQKNKIHIEYIKTLTEEQKNKRLMDIYEKEQEKNSSALFQKIDLLSASKKEDISTTTKKKRMATNQQDKQQLTFCIPTYGRPYYVGDGSLKTIQTAVGGRIEGVDVRGLKLIIHPLFAIENDKWRWASKMLFKDNDVKVYCNENGVYECSVNVATILGDKNERKGECPHLFGDLAFVMSMKTFKENTDFPLSYFEREKEDSEDEEDEEEDEEEEEEISNQQIVIPQTEEKKRSDLFDRLLKEKPTSPLLVNGKEIPLKVGTKTKSGYYKNGWKIIDVNGDGKFQQLNIYTSRQQEVDTEHRIMFKRRENGEWKLVVLEGFNGVDLLKHILSTDKTYVSEYLQTLLNR